MKTRAEQLKERWERDLALMTPEAIRERVNKQLRRQLRGFE